MTEIKNTTPSKKQHLVLLFVCVFALVFFILMSQHLKTFQRTSIKSDVIEYYAFIPAAFECKDLSFKNGCPPSTGIPTTKEGLTVNKRSLGMAYMYLPFYGISQLLSTIQGHYDNGYSRQTQNILVAGIWVYMLIGLFFLGKALYRFFPTTVVVTTLLILLTATNLVWYTNGEPLFTHAVNFMWLSILIYLTMLYHQTPKIKYILGISISVSMLAMIRPNNLLLASFPFLYGVYDKETLKQKWQLIASNYSHFLLAAVVFLIPVIPQFMYWKYASGKFVYYSYMGENFFWDRPYIFQVLFSFRKGWLIYTPVMLLSLTGLLFLKKQAKQMFLPVVFILVVFLYIISCWWAWSYGGCYGMRPMIDIYPLLAFSLAAMLNRKKWWFVVPMSAFIILCVVLNVFQSWQYSRGILHYDQMNYKTYQAIWRRQIYPVGYDVMVSYPDYNKELAGKGSFYDLREITEMEVSMKYIRAKFVCSADSAGTGIKADHKDATNCDAFTILFNSFEHKFSIRSSATLGYWKMDPATGFIHSNERDLLKASLFEVISMGQNKFCLKASNGMFVTSTEGNQFRLKADSKDISESCYIVMRKYMR